MTLPFVSADSYDPKDACKHTCCLLKGIFVKLPPEIHGFSRSAVPYILEENLVFYEKLFISTGFCGIPRSLQVNLRSLKPMKTF